MTKWEVNDYLSELISLSDEEKELSLKISETSLREISEKLRADADSDDIRITAASAALAYYKLMLRRCADESNADSEITSFRAGDVDITQKKNDSTRQLSYAKNMLEEKLIELAPICKDNNFAFTNVEVKVKI